MQHNFEHRPMDKGLRRAGIKRAWAIVMSVPGEEGFLMDLLREMRWEFHRPFELAGRSLQERPLFPGYVFVRPPIGQRWRLMELPHVGRVLKRVIFDRLMQGIMQPVEEAAAKVLEQEDARKTRAARGPRRIYAFADLSELLVSGTVDSERIEVVIESVHESARTTADLEDYLRTDDFADNQANDSAKAMVRRQFSFK